MELMGELGNEYSKGVGFRLSRLGWGGTIGGYIEGMEGPISKGIYKRIYNDFSPLCIGTLLHYRILGSCMCRSSNSRVPELLQLVVGATVHNPKLSRVASINPTPEIP